MAIEVTEKSSEDQHQIAFASWFRKNNPGVLIFHIPNGGTRNLREALKLKCMGVTPGIPDLFIPSLRLWIEMKKIKGKLSDEQKEVITYLESHGYHVLIGFGFDDAKEKFLHHCAKKV